MKALLWQTTPYKFWQNGPKLLLVVGAFDKATQGVSRRALLLLMRSWTTKARASTLPLHDQGSNV